ncbi:hypothetical protein FB45DRAFT_932722, partial [Roridomyces roridus]
MSSIFTELPEEVIEQIADCMRYPIYPSAEAAAFFLNEGRTGFSETRFALSAFSQVCTYVRPAVERLLYRDIHVDITGWTQHIRASETQKLPMFPAGSLRLLLRTLADRPELGRFVRSAYIRWCEHYRVPASMPEHLKTLLSACPKLHTVAFSSLPQSVIEYLEPLNLPITSLAAVSPAETLPSVIRAFPALRSLQLHIHGQPPETMSIPAHNITSLHLKLMAEDGCAPESELLPLAYTVPHGNVPYVYLESETEMALTPPPEAMQSSVEHLRLKNIDPFTPVHIDGVMCSPIGSLTNLQHLHVMRSSSSLPIHAFDFDVLPPNVRTVSFSDYAVTHKMSAAASKSVFVQGVVQALKSPRSRRLAGVMAYGAVPNDSWDLGNLKPLRDLCRKARVPFAQSN